MKVLLQLAHFIKEKITVKKVVLGLGLSSFLIIGIFYLLILLEPSVQPQNVIISNISDHQVSISWTTSKPTKGEVLISPTGKFPLLPIFTKQLFKDDREKILKRNKLFLTHRVVVNNLNPQKVYSFRIYQGWKKKYEAKFKTGVTLTSITTPNPVYGKIVAKDSKTPVAGALVYIWATTEATNSALLSTLTNNEGRWSVDLSNLRTTDFKSRFKLNSKSVERIIIDSGEMRVKAQTLLGKDKPWPNLGI